MTLRRVDLGMKKVRPGALAVGAEMKIEDTSKKVAPGAPAGAALDPARTAAAAGAGARGKMIAALTLLPLLASFACSSSPAASSQKPADNAPQTVDVVRVEPQKLDTKLDLPAQLTPYQAVDVYPKVSGFVDSIRVDRGSHVRAGEVIAKLSAPELVAQRSQAEAHLQAAQSQLAAAQAKLASDEGTYTHLAAAAKTPGVVAGNDLAVAEQAAAADRAQVQAANNDVQAARDGLRSVSQLEQYLEIRAPFDGVVTQRNLHPGALAAPSGASAQPIVHIEDTNRLRLTVPVPEAYAAGIKAGQAVAFTVPEYPGRSFHAPIARVADSVSQTTRTMAVELDVRRSDPPLTPGTFASVEWPLRRSYPTLMVPASAIATDLQRTFVIRVRSGKAEWVDVKPGVTVSGKTEVFGDLQPGDALVRNATDAIRPGTALNAKQ